MDEGQKLFPQVVCEALQQQDVFMEGFNYPATVQHNLNIHIFSGIAYKNALDLLISPYILKSSSINCTLCLQFKDC